MAQDLGGFTIARSTSVTMLLIFSVYSIIIVGFGFYVKAQARKGGSDNLASFLTGGGNIGAFSIAMIAILPNLIAPSYNIRVNSAGDAVMILLF